MEDRVIAVVQTMEDRVIAVVQTMEDRVIAVVPTMQTFSFNVHLLPLKNFNLYIHF